MTFQMTNIPIIEEDGGKATKGASLVARFNGGGFGSVDCEPISDGYFRILMALVVVATFAFGCIVHGWLI